MSKYVKITPEILKTVVQEFSDAIKDSKFPDGKITFSKTIAQTDRKASLFLTDIAWAKMKSLVMDSDKEIAWHGIAKRGDNPNKDEYIISDILVYPQEVTGATVNTDQAEYQDWLYSQPDEVFNNIRMQGHSHVNMSTSPSGVDTSLYERILEQLDEDMFYIFIILNKRDEKTVKIYDIAKNILFETNDIDLVILDDGYAIHKFIEEAHTLVKTKTYIYSSYSSSSYPESSQSKKEEKLEKSGDKTTSATNLNGKRIAKRRDNGADVNSYLRGYPYYDEYWECLK